MKNYPSYGGMLHIRKSLQLNFKRKICQGEHKRNCSITKKGEEIFVVINFKYF